MTRDVPGLRLGDRIRINAELITALQTDVAYQQQVVIVDRIEREDDGTLTLWLRSQ